MINANELRRGNWILENNKPIQVDEIRHWYFGDAEPIELTPEILEKVDFDKLGFIKWKGGNTFSKEFGDGNVIQVRGKSISLGGDDSCTGGMMFGLECEYLHQLQNLYFALTYEELTINL